LSMKNKPMPQRLIIISLHTFYKPFFFRKVETVEFEQRCLTIMRTTCTKIIASIAVV